MKPEAQVLPALPSAAGGYRPAGSGRIGITVLALAVALAGLLAPSLVNSPFYLALLTQATIMAIAAVGVGFLMYQCGLVMFGVAGFYGGAAYVVAMAVNHLGLGTMGAALLGLFGTTTLAVLIGILIVRTRPLPFAMLTLALGQMLRQFVTLTSVRSVTGGDDGLPVSFEGSLLWLDPARFSQPADFWPLAWLGLCAAIVLVWLAGRSRWGLVLRAIRVNEERMRFSGFNTFVPRLAAFALACFLISGAGVLAALSSAFVSPELLDFATGGNILVATIIGGTASALGPVLGSLLFSFGQDQFGASGHLELLTGIAVVVVIAACPSGVYGFLVNLVRRPAARKEENHAPD